MRFLVLATVYIGMAADAADTNLAEFQKGVAEYVKVRNAAKASTPALPGKATPEQIQQSERSLAEKIIAKRVSAKMGDVFTAPAQESFRMMLKSELAGSANAASRQVAHQGDPVKDSEGGAVPEIAVNAVYPHSAPMSSIPPKLLARLPALPEGIQYRFVGSNLLLVDTSCNVIIDYMKGVPGL